MKKIINVTGAIMMASAAFLILLLRFSNPDMSETRLFIEYWYFWLAFIILLLVGAVLSRHGKN